MRAVDARALLSTRVAGRCTGRRQVQVSACAACRRGVCLIPPPLRRSAGTGVAGASEQQRQTVHLAWGPRRRASASGAALSQQSSGTSGGPAEAHALDAFLDRLKWDDNGLVVAIAQNVDTGAVMMQAFANREAVKHTLATGKATFWTRSRQRLWTKGESSNNFINVTSMHVDCDGDSLVYLGVPDGPSCHTNADTCYFTRVDGPGGAASAAGGGLGGPEGALTTLQELEYTVALRAAEPLTPDVKPSWTRRLLSDPALLCSKVREEAGELCATLEQNEGKQRAASEAADLVYHATVLLQAQGVGWADVMAVLRSRAGVSGIAEKAARGQKTSV